MTKAEAYDMIKAIDAHGEGLTEWEVEFIASFIKYPDRFISDKQIDIIKRIYREKCKDDGTVAIRKPKK